VFARYHLGTVYHHVQLNASPRDGWDLTLCRMWLASQGGVPVWTHYADGTPTPVLTASPPPGLPLCQHCARKIAQQQQVEAHHA